VTKKWLFIVNSAVWVEFGPKILSIFGLNSPEKRGIKNASYGGRASLTQPPEANQRSALQNL